MQLRSIADDQLVMMPDYEEEYPQLSQHAFPNPTMEGWHAAAFHDALSLR